jgi:hypothetical protein
LQTPKIETSLVDIIEQKKKNTNQYSFNKGNKLAFHKRKILFDDIPEEENEEKPIFNIDNKENVKYIQDIIDLNENQIEKNQQDYINFMNKKQFENYNYNNNLQNQNTFFPKINSKKKINYSRSVDNINNNNYQKKFVFPPIKHEITNPDLYFKKANGDFYKYRAESKKYLDYNQKILENQNKYNKTDNINVNPFNNSSSSSSLGKSNLVYNTILNPCPNFSYNKYFEKQILGMNNVNNNYNYSRGNYYN